MRKIAMVILMMLLMGLSVFAQNGVIREISGTVELKPANAQAFVAAKNGDQVAQDTVISTGFKSSALVEVGSTVITLRPLTRLTLKEISASAGAETLNVNLQAGRVRVDVSPPAGTRASMTVSSPNATASVRGTLFDFDVRSVSVLNGVVDFSGSRDGVSTPVSASSISSVTQEGKVTDSLYVYTGTSGASADSTVGAGDGILPQAPIGSDPASGSALITGGSAEPAAPPPITPPPIIPPPTTPPPTTPPPTTPPPTTPPTDPPTTPTDPSVDPPTEPPTTPPTTPPTPPPTTPPTTPPGSSGGDVSVGIDYK